MELEDASIVEDQVTKVMGQQNMTVRIVMVMALARFVRVRAKDNVRPHEFSSTRPYRLTIRKGLCQSRFVILRINKR